MRGPSPRRHERWRHGLRCGCVVRLRRAAPKRPVLRLHQAGRRHPQDPLTRGNRNGLGPIRTVPGRLGERQPIPCAGQPNVTRHRADLPQGAAAEGTRQLQARIDPGGALETERGVGQGCRLHNAQDIRGQPPEWARDGENEPGAGSCLAPGDTMPSDMLQQRSAWRNRLRPRGALHTPVNLQEFKARP